MGYQNSVLQSWTHRGIDFNNLVVTIEGSDPELKDQIVIVGAHYDVQNSLSGCWRGKTDEFYATQGADDNGSGTIGCMALLKRWKDKNTVFPRTVIVACFDAEEPGSRNQAIAFGSSYFMTRFKESEMSKIKVGYNMDMIGGPSTNPEVGFTCAVDNVNTKMLKNAIRESMPEIKVLIASKSSRKYFKYNLSNLTDSRNFLKHGIPTLFLSNIVGIETLPDFYHTEEDTLEIIDWESMNQAIDLSEGILDFCIRNDISG